MSASRVKRLKRRGSGILGLARHSDCPSHMPVPSIVLVLFMVHLKELLTHAILPHTNAATRHALSCQTMPDLARPKQAHLCKWQEASQVWWAFWICLSSSSLCLAKLSHVLFDGGY